MLKIILKVLRSRNSSEIKFLLPFFSEYKTDTLSVITTEGDVMKIISVYEESLIAMKPVIRELAQFLCA